MFKKSMAALAVLSLSAGLASASEVTLYGIVDNGLLYKHSKVETNGVSTKTDSFALESGISSPSRFGIKGSEDLGNGMTVSFKLENGFNADDGSFGDDRLVLLELGIGYIDLRIKSHGSSSSTASPP